VRKVLIVSPRFAPKSAPDLHRIRISLPYYRAFGWEPTVLCLTPETSDGIDDQLLAESVPKDIDIVRVSAWSEEKCRRFGFGHVDYRCLLPLYMAGSALLKKSAYDVIFFSTTAFLTFLLGPIWKRRFGSKIVYDFQDPWYQETSLYTKSTVPGKWWKYRLGQMMSRHFEPYALRGADQIISVSEGYVKNLSERYPWFDARHFTVIPFGGAIHDFDFIKERAVRNTLFPLNAGIIRWVYAGRGGPDMDAVLMTFFEQLAVLKKNEPAFAARLRIHFVGTNYSPAARTFKVVEPLALRYGVADIVDEHSDRIPYHETLALYDQCDAILLVGSSLAEYIPSKLFNCILSKKPILALFHSRSPAIKIALRFPNVFVAQFRSTPSESIFADSIAKGLQWLRTSKNLDIPRFNRELEYWTAKELTRVQCSVFSSACEK